MTIQDIEVLNFWVPGPPKTKGSLSARAPRCHCCPACKGYVGQPQLRDSVGSGRWRKLVAYQAAQAMKRQWPPGPLGESWEQFPIGGPAYCDTRFYLPGQSIYEICQQGAGDLDKLDRNVFDALQDAGVIVNDSQIIGGYHEKWIVDPHPLSGDRGVGVHIVIRTPIAMG